MDDHCPWGDVSNGDLIVCFELPCHARQSRNYKKEEDDPFIVPVFLCDSILPSRSPYGRDLVNYFGYPFFVVLDDEQASDPSLMYDAIIERLERWSPNVRDLYQWEAGPVDADADLEEVAIPITSTAALATETVTEIKENGYVVTVEQPLP